MTYKQTIRDIIYSSYFNEVNMSLSELLSWKKNPLSQAELNPFLNATIELRFLRKARWKPKHYRLALRFIAYIRKAKGNKKKRITLMSFGYRIVK